MNSKEIQNALVLYKKRPIALRKGLLAIPNVSWGFFNWGEADLIFISRSMYIFEVEIKTRYSDFLAEAKKKKFLPRFKKDRDKNIRRFFYAAPQELAEQILKETEEHIGVLSVTKTKRGLVVTLLRKSKENRLAKKVTAKDLLKLVRLQSFRFFKRGT